MHGCSVHPGKNGGTKNMHIFMKVRGGRKIKVRRKIKLLKNIFRLLYIVFL